MDDDDLERYSMGDLPDEGAEEIEQHLIVCDTCRVRLEETEAFVRAMTAAAARNRAEAPSGLPLGFPPRLAWTLAAGMAALILLGIGLTSNRSAVPIAVMLDANRGAAAAQQAPARTPLDLHPDVSGLPVFMSYHLQIVDSTGKAVWQGVFRPGAGAKVPGQAPGTYFVRIYSPVRQLLREYGLQIGS
jgi:hypothetical protein